MTSFQKIIKYMAMAFAIFLAINIITTIVDISFTVFNSISNTNDEGNINTYSEKFEGVKGLCIELTTGNLSIKSSDHFEVISNNRNENFEVNMTKDNLLNIISKSSFLGIFNSDSSFNSEIIVLVPSDFIATLIDIDTGAAHVELNDISTTRLSINAGVGDVNGTNIVASKVKLNGGVGDMNFKNASFRDANIKSGIGSTSIEGELLGDNTLDCGVGEIDLILAGNIDLYNLKVNHGLGDVTIDGVDSSNLKRNIAIVENSLTINAGLGDITIEFAK